MHAFGRVFVGFFRYTRNVLQGDDSPGNRTPYPSTLPGTLPGLCSVPRYPSDPAPRPPCGGCSCPGGYPPGRVPGAGCFTTCPPRFPCSLFRVPGARGATPRPGCFRPVRLFDTHHHRGLSLNTRPLSGDVGTRYPTAYPSRGWWGAVLSRRGDTGTPAPFRGFGFRGKAPRQYRHHHPPPLPGSGGSILSRPTLAKCSPLFSMVVALSATLPNIPPRSPGSGAGVFPAGSPVPGLFGGYVKVRPAPGVTIGNLSPRLPGAHPGEVPRGAVGVRGEGPHRAPPGTTRGAPPSYPRGFLPFFGGIVTLPLATPLYVPPSPPFWRVLLRCHNVSAFYCKSVTKSTFKTPKSPKIHDF